MPGGFLKKFGTASCGITATLVAVALVWATTAPLPRSTAARSAYVTRLCMESSERGSVADSPVSGAARSALRRRANRRKVRPIQSLGVSQSYRFVFRCFHVEGGMRTMQRVCTGVAVVAVLGLASLAGA